MFAIGTGVGGTELEDEGALRTVDGTNEEVAVAWGGGEGVEVVPCIAVSIQFVICAALNSSELGSWLDGSSWWQIGHSSSSAIGWCRGGRGSGRDWCSFRGTRERRSAWARDEGRTRGSPVGMPGTAALWVCVDVLV